MSYIGRENLHLYKESERKRQSAHRAKLRAYVLGVKLSGCKRCGESHPACLQFHHIDPSTKVDRVNRLLAQTKSLEKVKIEISKCELLCGNCHAKEHWDETHKDRHQF
jgi:hypothetical protein